MKTALLWLSILAFFLGMLAEGVMREPMEQGRVSWEAQL